MLQKDSPPIYCEWAGYHAIAAALQRKVWIRYKKREVFPNLYIVLVGPPRIGKSTAISSVRTIMRRHPKIFLAPDAMSKEKMYVNMSKIGASLITEIPGVPGPYMHASYNVAHSELGVLLSKHDNEFIKSLCQLYDCEPAFIHDTKNAGTQIIENTYLNLIGATTIAGLRDLLPGNAFELGFAARLNLVYAEDKRETAGEAPQLGEKSFEKVKISKEENDLLADLEQIAKMIGPFEVEPEMNDAFWNWWNPNGNNAEPKLGNMLLASYNAARDIHMLKLCMIHAAARRDDRLIRLEDFQRAKTALEMTEADMEKSIVQVAKNEQLYAAKLAVSYIKAAYAKRKTPVPEHEVRSVLFSEIPAHYIGPLLEHIVKAKWAVRQGTSGDYYYVPVL